MRAGVILPFGPLKISNAAQVEQATGHPIPSLYAAGEIVHGLCYHNYGCGTVRMSAAIFGRFAERGAAA